MDARLIAALESVSELLSVWTLKVLGALALLVVGVLVARGVRRGVRGGLSRIGMDDGLVSALASSVYYVIVAMVSISVVGAFGIETASLITIFGAASLAIGLALQGSLSNLAAGFMLMIFHPFREGDYVQLGEDAGTVTEIGLFSTGLRTLDNVRVTVPNASFSDRAIRNFSANGTRRNDIVIGISDAEDLPRALEIARRVLDADPRVLADPAPVVVVGEMGDGAANLFVRPWCLHGDYWDVRFDVTRRVAESLQEAGCAFSCPQREIRLVRDETGDAGGSRPRTD